MQLAINELNKIIEIIEIILINLFSPERSFKKDLNPIATMKKYIITIISAM